MLEPEDRWEDQWGMVTKAAPIFNLIVNPVVLQVGSNLTIDVFCACCLFSL